SASNASNSAKYGITADISRSAEFGAISYRPFAEDGHAAQQAAFARGKIRARMQRAAIIPHQDVVEAPDMLVDKFRLLLVGKQFLQECVAFFPWQALDPAGHQPVDIKCLAPGCGMRAHDRMPA